MAVSIERANNPVLTELASVYSAYNKLLYLDPALISCPGMSRIQPSASEPSASEPSASEPSATSLHQWLAVS